MRSRASRKRNIIANPNCSTAQLVVALKPLHDAATIKRVVVSTYQSVSGAGKDAMDELFEQTRAVFTASEVKTGKFPKRIAFNVIPHIDVFMEDGSTKEEWKMMVETKKILDPKIKLHATCVRVPVFIGHSEAVNVEFERPITVEEAREVLRAAPGILIVDKHEPGGYVTPHEAAGEDATYVSRLREDPTVENGLAFWCVSDNLRKGAALNAVQIAEVLINRGLITAKKKAAWAFFFLLAREGARRRSRLLPCEGGGRPFLRNWKRAETRPSGLPHPPRCAGHLLPLPGERPRATVNPF